MAQFQPGATVYTQGFGSRPENVEVPFIATRAPASTDVEFPVGKRWLYSTSSIQAEYVLANFTSSAGVLSANWIVLGGGSSDVNTINGLSPTSGNITIAGTTNQISIANAGSTVTLSLPSAITAPGSLSTTTSLTAGSGFTVSAGAVQVTSGTSAITISDDAAATTLKFGTGGAAKTVTIGSSNTTSTTTIAAGSGNINLSAINTVQSLSSAGVAVTNQLTNSDNTSGTSNASYQVAVGGASSGDPYIDFLVSGAGHFAMGIDNSVSDNFVLAASGTLGTSNVLSITSAGAMTSAGAITATLGNITATNGNLSLGTAGNKLSIATGANASVGTATLVGGTVTVSTTAVTASSIILLTRQSVGATGAAATGNLTVGTVTASTSFVINAVQAADATALQASDVSVIGWMIIN